MSRAKGTRAERLALAVLALSVLAGPTPGDIGGCQQSPDDLDPKKFFTSKVALDCERCNACGLTTKACAAACAQSTTSEFPHGCYPVVHDGVVCLDALRAASCGDYRTFMADDGSLIPSECAFCPLASDTAR